MTTINRNSAEKHETTHVIQSIERGAEITVSDAETNHMA
jgi:hypothetical protein